MVVCPPLPTPSHGNGPRTTCRIGLHAEWGKGEQKPNSGPTAQVRLLVRVAQESATATSAATGPILARRIIAQSRFFCNFSSAGFASSALLLGTRGSDGIIDTELSTLFSCQNPSLHTQALYSSVSTM